jgi:preprotein translocase subunit YajC
MWISEAYAQSAQGGGGLFDASSPLGGLLFPLILFAAIFMFMVRPQMKRSKELKQMVASLQKGDEVVTAGGTLGRIAKVGDQFVNLEIAPNIEMTVQKSSIQLVLPKGTMKSVS